MRATGAVVLCVLAVGPLPQAGAAAVSSVQAELDKAAAEYSRLETELGETLDRKARVEQELDEAQQIIAERADQIQLRAGHIYKSGGVSTFLSSMLLSENPSVFFRRMYFMERLGRSDRELVGSLQVMQSRSDELLEDLDSTIARQRELVASQREKRRDLESRLKGARGAARVSRIRSFSAFSIPIDGATAFADTWGAPRSGGRRHQGTDVMASCGAPVVAVTDGVISRLHSGGNGGIMAYLRAGNGDVFFYAHLQNYAPGISTGSRVSAGQRIGSNGNTGNARGGPCHVHFEWHPGGGRPRNPYPLLAAAR
ncbi:MAG: peptidoglycan DD-metalloendopeptidase family protein [Actinomycetota bacterium]